MVRVPHSPRAFKCLLTAVVFLVWTGGCGPVPSDPLERAAFDGDAARVAALTAAGQSRSPHAFGALIWACRQGRVDAIATLLNRGVDPNRHDDRLGWTPLMHALHKHQAAAARLLLDRGADPRIGTASYSPIEMAALDDDADLVARMLTAGIARDQLARAIEIAVSGGALVDIDRALFGSCKTQTVRVLLAADPALRADVSAGLLSSRWWAARQGCDGTLRLLAAATNGEQ